jgi:hypothetical protein
VHAAELLVRTAAPAEAVTGVADRFATDAMRLEKSA